jgi:hypothetical protein
MLEKEANGDANFEAIFFCTNLTKCKSVEIIKQYIMSTMCSDIIYPNEYNASFKHSLTIGNNSKIVCKSSYSDISHLPQNLKINDIDCFIIFYDLENSDSLSEFNKIIKMISDVGDPEKKIYIISFYTNEKNIRNNLNEDDIENYCEKYSLNNYDISKVNIFSDDELRDKIDSITIESLQGKKIIIGDLKDYDADKSRSGCLIF